MKKIFIALVTLMIGISAVAQVESAGGVRRRDKNDKKKEQGGAQITDRMQGFYEYSEPHDADLVFMRTIYRQLDLTQPENTPLYFPEDVLDGQENLFRIILGLVVNEQIPAYEYLDGREVFTDEYKINVPEMLERFGIYYTAGSGKGRKYVIEEADVPTNQVLNYYIIEKWEFDRRTNRMTTRVEAICPVLNRYGDFGGESKYPMFWVKFDALRPYLAQQYVFLTDDNNLAQYNLDDYFNLGMYKGDIYKTKNLRNLSMAQMYEDPDDLKQAQDSIDNRLRSFGKNLWVPTREEYLAMKEAEEAAKEAAAAAADELASRDGDEGQLNVVTAEPAEENKSAVKSTRKKRTSTTSSSNKKKKKNNAPKLKSSSSSSSSGNSNANKSVRRRKK